MCPQLRLFRLAGQDECYASARMSAGMSPMMKMESVVMRKMKTLSATALVLNMPCSFYFQDGMDGKRVVCDLLEKNST